ncbi:MAG: MFS transporter [Chloroflexi bacterium]|nr:MAG: MFS transporter [Chloroflexota bacterium]
MSEYVLLLRRNSNYRFLWFGTIVSLLGDWFNLIASAELITDLTDSGVAVSSLFLARFLPLFLFSPLAGVLADRYDRKWLMIGTDVARAVTVLGFLFIRSAGQVWLLYVLVVMQFALSAVFTPARSAMLANIVVPSELVTANALDSLTWSTMLAFGAFLGGVVAAVFGAETAFVLDALTFLVSAVLVARIVLPPVSREGDFAGGSGWLDFWNGFRYLWRERSILLISLVKGVGSLVWGAINVLEVVYAERIFPLRGVSWGGIEFADPGTAALGMIYVMSGIGTGVGPLVFRRWLGDRPQRLLAGISLGLLLLASGIMGLSLAPNLLLFLVATLVRTVGSGVIWVFSAALLQMLVPDRFRGRVFAFEFAVLTLTQSVSILYAGVAQDNWGWSVQSVTAVTGMTGFAFTLLWFLVYFGHLRKFARQIIDPS